MDAGASQHQSGRIHRGGGELHVHQDAWIFRKTGGEVGLRTNKTKPSPSTCNRPLSDWSQISQREDRRAEGTQSLKPEERPKADLHTRMKRMTASHTGSIRCSRAHSVWEKRSTNARDFNSAEECKVTSLDEGACAGGAELSPA